jgi:hypothetical protein
MLAMAITTLGNLIVQFPDRTNLSAAWRDIKSYREKLSFQIYNFIIPNGMPKSDCVNVSVWYT